jgi:hypothetical protein
MRQVGESPIVSRAISFLRLAQEAESENRSKGLEDLRFRHGEQWPAELQNKRELESRPALTINKMDTFCLQVENQQRQQRPRIKIDPTGSIATKKTAEVIQGLVRHIELNKGGGDLAYDTGFGLAATIGFGYWRVMADYTSDDSFEQELYLAPIDNPFTVYRDPNANLPDGSDQRHCLITSWMSKKLFKLEYPEASDGSNFPTSGSGDGMENWITKEDIRIAEYYWVEDRPETLCKLSDGTTAWKKELPSPEILAAAGVAIIDSRLSQRKQIRWAKVTGMEVLEERDLPGKFIPVVYCYGTRYIVDGKVRTKGLVRNGKDPARMANYWYSAITESIALAPKAKWLGAKGFMGSDVNIWANANTSTNPVLEYETVDIDGTPAQPPQRLQPEPPPAGAINALTLMNEALSGVLGIIDPAQRISGNVSGKALQGEKQQQDNGTFHYYDNMTRSIRHTGAIILDLIPHYYAEPGRVVRIVGDDGQSSTQVINAVVNEVLHDVTVGEYDVVMDVGPGYNSKRIEAVAAMMPLFEKHEDLLKACGDILFRSMDFPGSEVIADRLAAANPLAQIDEKSDVPPKAQMMIKQLQQQLQQAQQMLQAAELDKKYRLSGVELREREETKRELMRQHVKAHDVDTNDRTKREDVHIRSMTSLGVAEINAAGKMMDSHVKGRQMREMSELEHEQDKEISAEEAKDNAANPETA